MNNKKNPHILGTYREAPAAATTTIINTSDNIGIPQYSYLNQSPIPNLIRTRHSLK